MPRRLDTYLDAIRAVAAENEEELQSNVEALMGLTEVVRAWADARECFLAAPDDQWQTEAERFHECEERILDYLEDNGVWMSPSAASEK